MDPLIAVALIGFAGIVATGVLSPVILSTLTARAARSSRREDWARQDAVALAAQKAAAALQASQQQLIDATAVTSGKIQTVADQTQAIHGLVNSSYTAALQSDYDSTQRELAALAMNLLLLRQAAPSNGSLDYTNSDEYQDVVAAQTAAKARLAKLRSDLDGRERLATATASPTDTDRIVDAIHALPGQNGAPQPVTIVHEPDNPLPVQETPTQG